MKKNRSDRKEVGDGSGGMTSETGAGADSGDDVADELTKGRIVGRMSETQYWKWRTAVAEMRLADVEYQVAARDNRIILVDAEVARLKGMVHGYTVVAGAATRKQQRDHEYQEMRRELQREIGVDIAGKIIDETFCVREDPPKPA